MTIETYHIVLNSLGLALAVAGLLPLSMRRARYALIVAAVAFAAALGGELLYAVARARLVTDTEQRVVQELGEWGRPFDDLQARMGNVPPDVLRDALASAERHGWIKPAHRDVRDLSSARTYTIEVFGPSDRHAAVR